MIRYLAEAMWGSSDDSELLRCLAVPALSRPNFQVPSDAAPAVLRSCSVGIPSRILGLGLFAGDSIVWGFSVPIVGLQFNSIVEKRRRHEMRRDSVEIVLCSGASFGFFLLSLNQASSPPTASITPSFLTDWLTSGTVYILYPASRYFQLMLTSHTLTLRLKDIWKILALPHTM